MRVETRALGGSPLSRLIASGDAPQWAEPAPRSAAGWTRRAGEVAASANSGWLDALGAAFGPGGGGDRLRRVAERGGVVVTTGQQPGLFGGAVYTWSKALSALALADEIERVTGLPAAPVFWAATDDADFDEASSTRVAIPGGVELLSGRRHAADGTPMALAPLGDVSAQLAALRHGAGSASDATVLSTVEACYSPDASVGAAYVALLRAFLEPRGIAVLDASHERVRVAADPTLRAALTRASDVDAALVRRDQDLRSGGYVPQVALVSGLSVVFALDGDVKARVPIADAPAVARDAGAGSLGPNVLLRPVVERALLPTAAYVAGPGELAYFAQVGAVADAIGADHPMAVPRWSGRLVEPHVAAILARLGLEADDLAVPHAAETRLARRAMPSALVERLQEARESIAAAASELAAAADGIAPATLAEGWSRTVGRRTDRLERRYVAAVKRHADAVMRDVATARGALYPDMIPQERALNLLPLLARHGVGVLDAMLAAARRHAAAIVGVSTATNG